MKILEYKIIKESGLFAFSGDVNTAITEGFIPFGELIVLSTPAGNAQHYIQAMIKFDVPAESIKSNALIRFLSEKMS